MYLYQCEPVDIYLIVGGIIQYYSIYSVAHVIVALALPIGSWVPLPHPHQCGFCEHFLTFWHHKMLQAHVGYSLSQPWIQVLPQGALVPLAVEWY